MEEYTSLLEEYMFWVSEKKTSGLITTQLFNNSIKLDYKVTLIKNTLRLLRGSNPDTWAKYKDMLLISF